MDPIAGTAFSYWHGGGDAGRLTAQSGIDGLRTEHRLDTCRAVVAMTQAVGTAETIRIDLQRDALGRLVGKFTPETITRVHGSEAESF